MDARYKAASTRHAADSVCVCMCICMHAYLGIDTYADIVVCARSVYLAHIDTHTYTLECGTQYEYEYCSHGLLCVVCAYLFILHQDIDIHTDCSHDLFCVVCAYLFILHQAFR
jgi:hypothetical protein